MPSLGVALGQPGDPGTSWFVTLFLNHQPDLSFSIAKHWDTFLGSGPLLPAASCFFPEAETLEDGIAWSRGADCPALHLQDPGTPGAFSGFRVLGAGHSRSGLAWISNLVPATVCSSIPCGTYPLTLTTTSRDLQGHSQRTCSLTSPTIARSKMPFPPASG